MYVNTVDCLHDFVILFSMSVSLMHPFRFNNICIIYILPKKCGRPLNLCEQSGQIHLDGHLLSQITHRPR